MSGPCLLDLEWYFRLLRLVEPLIIRSAAVGALPTIRVAVDPNVKGGYYYGPGGWEES